MTTREETQAKLDRRAESARRHPLSSRYLIPDRIEERAAERGDHPFTIYGDELRTYGQLNAAMNRVAHAAQALGLKAGDVCALLMENRPDFLAILFGLSKLGAQVALINYNVTGKALEHALAVTGAKALVVGEERLANLEGLALPAELRVWLWPDPENPAGADLRSLASLELFEAQKTAPEHNPPASLRAHIKAGDNAFFIFTSGTTGLPKAALLSHARWLTGADTRADLMQLRSDDVYYCFLPMFHGAAIMSLVSSAITRGGTIVIRRKFSASGFWPDVRRYKITVVQYVGEVCRYLLNAAPSPDDRNHTIRQFIGTGLAIDIWDAFKDRFGIPEILDSYGATEANLSVPNIDNKPGAAGRIPFWEKSNVRFVRYDVEEDTHPRDENGWMILAEPGEPGEAIGRIQTDPDISGGRFEGYTSAEDTEKKILRDVFAPGDAWWRSGDLLRCDEDGYVFFVDRIGDTFRWKSENVSTQEAAEALSDFPGLVMVNVYGVKVPDNDGRAGMAALVMEPGHPFDPKAFHDLAVARLPPYAVPLFLRISAEPDVTASLKQRKVDLQQQGYDPAAVGEPLYVLDPPNQTYAPYDAAVLARNRIRPFEAA